MTCNYCKNNNMSWCLSGCYNDTFKCPNCGTTVEIRQNKYLLTKFLMVWSSTNEIKLRS